MNHSFNADALFKKAPYPVFILRRDGSAGYTNDHFTALDEIIYDGDAMTAAKFAASMATVLTQDDAAAVEAKAGGSTYRFSSTPIDDGWLVQGADITAMANERDFYKEALDNLPADIGVFDLDGKYMYVNPAGIKDEALRKWIIGKTDFDYSHYRGKDTTMPETRKALAQKVIETRNEQGYEEEIRRPGQESDWQMRKLSPVFDNDGNIKFFLAYGINIKERKKAELAQKEALAYIEKSAKAKEEFVAVMSHEIRTPMNAIIGMSRLLAKTKLSQRQSQYLDGILAASGNLIVIVNDILDFSKIEAGKVRLEQAGFSFTEVIEYARAVTEQQAAEKKLQLEFNVDPDISDILLGDVYRINQVVVNLLNNAIKFTDRGKVSTNITVEDEDEQEQRLCICVCDTGIGMTASFMEEMFTMYSQEEGITRRYGGTGLGLKITSQLVEMMDGEIEVESRKNEGSCIKVKLRLKKGTINDIPEATQLNFPEDALQGKNILIAEDNGLNVLVASTVLQNYGAAIVVAQNGREAIDILSSPNDIHAVLMDIEMPVMDGLEATNIIRRELSLDLPVIAVTANVMPEDKEKLAAAGMNGFVAKPFAEAELVGTLLKNLG